MDHSSEADSARTWELPAKSWPPAR